MLKTGVLGTWVDHRRKSQLLDAVETLHRGMSDHLHDQPLGDVDKSEDWVVDNLAGLHRIVMLCYYKDYNSNAPMISRTDENP